MKLNGCNALVTGASSGIGRELARQLAGRAKTMVLVARRRDRLEELSREMMDRYPHLATYVQVIDLTDRSQIDMLIRWLDEKRIAIDFLINNAGLGDLGSFAESDPRRNWEILLVNVAALTALTRGVLPRMIAEKRGAILNVSSSAGFLPIPGFAVYAASKAYVNSFSEALRIELMDRGITVTALCPGPVQTEFTSVAYRHAEQAERGSPAFVHVPVEKVARDALAAVERDRALVIPGNAMKIAMILTRATPLPLLRLVARISRKRR
jgi:uncharacterized protein